MKPLTEKKSEFLLTSDQSGLYKEMPPMPETNNGASRSAYVLAFLFLLAASAALSAGCTVTNQIRTQEQAKHLLNDRNGVLIRADNSQIDADDMYVFGDSLLYIDREKGMKKTLALRDLRKIETANSHAGAWQGTALAFAGCAAWAYVYSDFGKTEVDGLWLAPFAAATAGALIGGEIGSPASYDIYRDSLQADTFRPEGRDVHIAERKQYIKKVVRAGIELGNYLTRKSGSFSNNRPGYSVGISTALHLNSFPESYTALGIELDYSHIDGYFLNVPFEGYGYYPGVTHQVKLMTRQDEHDKLSFLDIGLLPQYVFSLSENMSASIYAGASLGFGSHTREYRHVSTTLIDSSSSNFYVWSGAGEEFEGQLGVKTVSLGASFFYRNIMIDLRYRATNFADLRQYKNLYLQLGFVL